MLIKWNGPQLPDSLLKLKDLTYRLLKQGAGGPSGYIYEYHLPPEYFPKRGHNTVEVTLQTRDPNVSLDFQVYDVDCAIAYADIVTSNLIRSTTDVTRPAQGTGRFQIRASSPSGSCQLATTGQSSKVNLS